MRPKKTILCVDDNEQVLSVRTFLLETRGYRIIAVNNAQEAIEVLERSLPGTVDLILCDLLMPQMDGNELVRRAKQLHPGLPAMIVSGTVNAFDRALHADVFLPKGASSPAEMIERIRVLVARKRGPQKSHRPHRLATCRGNPLHPRHRVLIHRVPNRTKPGAPIFATASSSLRWAIVQSTIRIAISVAKTSGSSYR